MSTNCNSSPLGTCNDSHTLEQLQVITDMVETKLTSIIDKKIQIIADLQNCTTINSGMLDYIILQFQTLIDNDCCEETNNILQDIIDTLNDLINGTSCQLDGFIECNITPTTTEEPATTLEPTTTVAPTTTLPEDSGVFFVSNIAMLTCIEEDLPAENEKTLYFTGLFGIGSQMYTDVVGGTLLTGYSYIKPLGSSSVFNLGLENGVVGTIFYTCE